MRTDVDGPAAVAAVELVLAFTALMLFFASATFFELSTFPPDPQALATHSTATTNPRSALSRSLLIASVIAAKTLTHTRIRSC